MKSLNKILIMTAAIMIAASCEQMPADTEYKQVELTPMTFTAGVDTDVQVETKTTYSGRGVYWEADDAVSVFFNGDQITKQEFTAYVLSEDKTQAGFEGLGDAVATEYVAVYPHSDATAFDGTNLTVSIPSVQVGVAQGFASGANVSVAYSSDNALQFRNIGALIAFRFDTAEDAAKTASVTIKAKTAVDGQYYGLTGSSSVDLQEGLPIAGEGSADYVTVMAPEGGFESGDNKVYYAVVYPGAVNGFEMTFTTNDETPEKFVLNNDGEAELKRNWLLSFGAIPNPYDTLPEEVTLTLDFASGTNPLGTFPKRADQSAEGDDYTYQYAYEFNGASLVKDFTFTLYKGAEGYLYTTKNSISVLQIVKPNSSDATKQCAIKLPAVSGRYLSSISISQTGTTYARSVRLQEDYPTAGKYFTVELTSPAAATGVAETVISMPTGATESAQIQSPVMGKGYVICFRSNAVTDITNITVTYTKTKPATEK